MDLSNEYHNIRIQSPHEKHAAFVTLSVTHSTRIMQHGDCNSATTLQKIMHNHFSNQSAIIVYVYIDDIFILNRTYKQHLDHVKTVIRRVKDHKFLAYRRKSQFLLDILSIWVHIITKRGISPVPQKVTTIPDWPDLQQRQKLKSFLWMVNYLHQFAPNPATVSSPLTELAGSTSTWQWTPLYSESFQGVNYTLAADAAGRPGNYNSIESIHLVTDAILLGTGASVGQGAKRNEIRLVLIHSSNFNAS